MKVRELYAYLNEKIPPSLSLDRDNDGLMCCPDGELEVQRVLVTLDATEEMVELAIREGYDTIVTHHPMIYRGMKSVNPFVGTQRKVIRLIGAGVTVMSFHTRLDAVEGGVNDCIAGLLGIRNTIAFGLPGEEIGRLGTLEREMTLEEFCALVRQRLGDPLVLAGDAHRSVFRVAVLGGSGGDEVAAALACGADTYLSGRLDYHDLTDAPENGINLVEAGHFYTEFPVCVRLKQLVLEALPDAEVRIENSCRIRIFS